MNYTDKIIRKCEYCKNTALFDMKGSYDQLRAIEMDDDTKKIYGDQSDDFDFLGYYDKEVWQLLRCLICNQPTVIYKFGIVKHRQGYNPDGDPALPRETIIDETLVQLYPDINDNATIPIPEPAKDMPLEITKDYNEAKAVFCHSPRASAALLRLAIQKLCKHLGQSGKNISEDIAALVKTGLPIKIQQSLDIVRVIGNNAVHPGELDLQDDQETVLSLFKIVNFIIEEMITRPKEIEEIYNKLPENARKSIEKRDQTK